MDETLCIYYDHSTHKCKLFPAITDGSVSVNGECSASEIGGCHHYEEIDLEDLELDEEEEED